MIYGECNCGDVKFEIYNDLSDVFICHCSICRRSTGSGGIAITLTEAKVFKWTKGKDNISKWSKPGHDWHTLFCKTCGSPLPGENDDKQVYVPVGLLNSVDDKLNVVHHLWTNSKASWEIICDTGTQHPEGYGS